MFLALQTIWSLSWQLDSADVSQKQPQTLWTQWAWPCANKTLLMSTEIGVSYHFCMS